MRSQYHCSMYLGICCVTLNSVGTFMNAECPAYQRFASIFSFKICIAFRNYMNYFVGHRVDKWCRMSPYGECFPTTKTQNSEQFHPDSFPYHLPLLAEIGVPCLACRILRDSISSMNCNQHKVLDCSPNIISA